MTSITTHKKYKQVSQLQEYFDDIFEDYQKDESYQELMADPLKWWLKIGRDKYPVVLKMGANFLSIPCTSCECEYCFSLAKRSITCGADPIAISVEKVFIPINAGIESGITFCSNNIYN